MAYPGLRCILFSRSGMNFSKDRIKLSSTSEHGGLQGFWISRTLKGVQISLKTRTCI